MEKIQNCIELKDAPFLEFIARAKLQPPDKWERRIGKRYFDMDYKDFDLLGVIQYNESEGRLNDYDGIDCPTCKNRGDFKELNENNLQEYVQCNCMSARIIKRRLIKQGMREQLERCTLESFIAKTPWQKRIYEQAKSYIEQNARCWFFIGGQPGCGKTHICVAIVNELFKRHMPCEYIRWCDFATQAQALIYKSDEYNALLDSVRGAYILYIDDFLKPIKGEDPSTAELKRAFEILDYRYANNLATIISGERTIGEITAIDEATGSRIIERCKASNADNYIINVGHDDEKNLRST